MLTSMDRDGTKSGFDCPLTGAVPARGVFPVVAPGGAGEPHHFVEVFEAGAADAAPAASVFHFGLRSVASIGSIFRRLPNGRRVKRRWRAILRRPPWIPCIGWSTSLMRFSILF